MPATNLDGVEPDAIFELSETSVIEMVWFVAFDVKGPRSDDWLALLYKDAADQPWQLVTRVRSSTGGDAWNPEDTKQGFRVRCEDGSPETAAEMMRKTNLIYDTLRADPRHRASRTLIRGNFDRFVQRLRKQKWFHGRFTQAGPAQPQ